MEDDERTHRLILESVGLEHCLEAYVSKLSKLCIKNVGDLAKCDEVKLIAVSKKGYEGRMNQWG
jgi:hypothetical protein